jgi:signal recognition particle subunit SRP54
VLFVVDAMIGQDAVTTAQAFLDGVGYDAVVLTKLDGDARGGAALSIAALTGKPVMFASTGEKLSDFDLFHPDRMATRILDMGDVLSLIERAEKAFDAEQTASIAERMMSGEGFTLEDFVEQLQMLRKLGPLKNILGMMPGASKNKELLDKVNDKDLDRAEAIVRSMTPEERRNPKVINGSRRLRIAGGSGVTVGEVSQLVTNFFEGQKQMKMLMGGGIPGMPGIPGMGGGARRSAKKSQKSAKGKRRSGDPRKAALGSAGGSGGGAGAGAGAPALPAAAQAQEPQSMEELAEMLQQAQSAGGPAGFGGAGGGEGGFPGFGNPANVPQFPGGGSNVIPAAFGRRNKKKK